MSSPRWCVIWLALAAALGGQDPAPQPPTFRATTDAVSVEVSVHNRNRGVLTGLGATDFVILDNGVRQQVVDVSYGKVPIDVTIALDVSYSVTGALLDRLRRAVVQLMGDLGKEDRLRLILFNMRVSRSVDFTKDVAAVERAIRAAQAGGGTTLLDAMSVALVSASSADRRQLVVFFTDGADSSSTTEPAVLTGVAQRTRATMTFVMPMPVGFIFTGSAQREQSARFGAVAAGLGGTVLEVTAGEDLSATFRRVLDDFRSTYVLHFTPRGVDRGGFHTLDVSVTRDSAVVKARRGYFGG
jgi:VWFA-related protein